MLEAVEVLDRGLALERHAQPDSGNYFSFLMKSLWQDLQSRAVVCLSLMKC